MTGCSSCAEGLLISEVHILLSFGPEDVPVTFEISADVEEIIWDDASQCNIPGGQICASDITTITINSEGLYDISIPVNCDCLPMISSYALGLFFHTDFTSTGFPNLVIDASPVGCTSWNDWGDGWNDLVTNFGFPGELSIFADVDCCEDPVANESHSWDEIKSMFR